METQPLTSHATGPTYGTSPGTTTGDALCNDAEKIPPAPSILSAVADVRSPLLQSTFKSDYGSLPTSPTWTTSAGKKNWNDKHLQDHSSFWDYCCGGIQRQSRDRWSRFLDQSNVGSMVDIVEAIAALVFAGVYITYTYLPSDKNLPHLWHIELLCAGFFLSDFSFRGIALSTEPLDDMVSFSGFVNLGAILPVIPVSFFTPDYNFWTSDSYWRFVYPLRFLKVYIEVRRVINRFHNDVTPMTLFAVNAYLQILCLLFCAGGVIQIAETTYGDMDTYSGEWTFFNSCFNSLLLFVAMNYPTADNPLTKCFVMLLIVLLIIVVPYQLSSFFEIYGSYSSYEYDVLKPSRRMKHIVLCGDLTPNRIEHFFNEIFHEDHDLIDTRVAVLSDDEPSSDLVALLLDPFIAKRTTFLKGSILHDYDAERAACSSASAIFVLTRKVGQEDVNLSDHRTFMRAMAAHRVAKHVPIYAQLHLSSNKHLFQDIQRNNVLCFSEVIHSILAQNCLCPGFSTFIYNLTTTAGCESQLDDTWESRYLHGASHELYSVTLPPAEVGRSVRLAQASSWIYSQCDGVILFAIFVVPVNPVQGQGTIVLNPGSTYLCRGGEVGFVIARDRKAADAVTRLSVKSSAKPTAPSHSMLKADSVKDLALAPVADVVPKRKTGFVKKKRNSRTLVWAIQDQKHAGQVKRNLKDSVVYDITKLKLAAAPIVVCLLAPTFPDHMEYFVVPLRSPIMKEHHPIVFLTQKLPSRESYEPLSVYADVYFVETTKICLESLKRSGVEIAKRIVLMCGGGEFAETSSAELLADATSIATHKSITSLLGPARAPAVITELVNRANVHFISHNIASSRWFSDDDDPNAEAELSLVDSGSFSRSRAFASGLTYSTSLCDSLMINQFFNPMIKNIVREFVFSALRAHTAVFPNVSSPVKPGATTPNAIQRSALFTCEMPTDFVGKTFGYVFDYLLASDSILTLGIYRCLPAETYDEAARELPNVNLGFGCPPIVSPTTEDSAAGFADVVSPLPSPVVARPPLPRRRGSSRIEIPESSRPVPYGFAYVNPKPHDIMTGNDLIYVLAHKQPYWVS
ncbi:calcium-activated potassium channel subunit alpha-1 [Achlya hypogyna]|uniref:Calcium-activated potassium channel subunit alpha-1 n=1 Tax=Achlya hypogyna TaxID=1202772 RepID=A0A1V9Z0K4_ACHHY|nr:calcium-activated potassium channel subunit alpha-1 [Achlya hypogyna]